MTKILFVCHGNICRSPAAEFVFLSLAEKAGVREQFEAASAATSSEEIGNPVYPPMRRVLEAKGYDCKGKTARRIRRSDYDYYDLIIGMDDENKWNLRRFFEGDPDGKLHNLMEYTAHPEEEIPDPWYTRDFAGSLATIEYGCEQLLAHLTGIVMIDFSACADIPALYAELRLKMDWEPWYGNNLDALYDVLTGLPHLGTSFIFTMPSEDAPAEVRLVAERIRTVFMEAADDLSEPSAPVVQIPDVIDQDGAEQAPACFSEQSDTAFPENADADMFGSLLPDESDSFEKEETPE